MFNYFRFLLNSVLQFNHEVSEVNTIIFYFRCHHSIDLIDFWRLQQFNNVWSLLAAEPITSEWNLLIFYIQTNSLFSQLFQKAPYLDWISQQFPKPPLVT